MPVITINGPIGCGSVTIGQMVAEQLDLNFVDRQANLIRPVEIAFQG